MNKWGKKMAGVVFLILIGLTVHSGKQPTSDDWLNIIAVLIATGYVFD